MFCVRTWRLGAHDAEKGRQQGEGWPGESPVLAQRAVSEGCEGAGRPFFLLAEPPR